MMISGNVVSVKLWSLFPNIV